jgi:hypothetical protein
MPTDLSAIDLGTLNAAQGVIVAAIQNQCSQWEQQSADAAADSRLSNALMLEHWAFAADLLAGVVSSEFSTLFGRALDARFHLNSTRSVGDQLLDTLAIEVASAQGEPEAVPST